MICIYCGEMIEDRYFWTDQGMCIYCYNLYKNSLNNEEGGVPKKPMATAGKKELENQKKEVAR